MEITVKEVPPMLFLASKHRTTIRQLPAIADKIVPQIFAAAGSAGLAIAGPLQFLYDGVDGSMDKEFDLIVGLPIASKPATAPAPFEVLETGPFSCAALDYVGSMNDVQRGYEQLLAGMQEQDLQMSTKCREIYKHFVGYDSPENITELELGIA